MKNRLALILALAALASAALAAAGRLTVTVEEAKIRKSRMFYAPAVATVRYGETVQAGEKKDGWYPVTYDGQEGWIHESAVDAKGAPAPGGDWNGADAATNEEATLAGKGFNENVESGYRQRHPDLDFAAVDRMEARTISEKNLLRFLAAGRTLPEEAR